MAKIEIFKLQVPLVTTDPEPKALIYNEDRSAEGMFPVTSDILELMDGEAKIFIYGQYEEDGTVTLIGNAPWQEW